MIWTVKTYYMKRLLPKIIVLVVLIFPAFAFAQKTYILQENFAGLTSGDNTTTGGSGSAWAGNTNFPTVDRAYQAGGMVKLGTSSLVGSITSKPLNLSVNGGSFKIDFKVKGWTTVEGSIKVTVSGIATPQTFSYAAVMGSSSTETKTLSFTGGANNATIKIETTAKRAYIDEVEVYYEAASNTPSITASPLSFGNQNVNVASSERTLALNYANLDGSDVTLTTAAPYTISATSGGTFTNSFTLTGASLTGTSKNIFVKFEPTSTGVSNGAISITGGGLASTASVALTGTGVDPSVLSFDFENCTPSGSTTLPAGFTHQNVTGVQTWACTSFGRDASDATGKASSGNAVQINGGSSTSSTENEDWLISKDFNLSTMTYPMLSFWSRTAFAGNNLQLKVSTNYDGVSLPSTATWSNIDGKFPMIQSDTWTKSDNIDLSNYKGTKVYIAFVYTSPNATPSSGARWTLDDFAIRNSSIPAPVELSLPVSSLSFGYQATGVTSAARSFTFSASGLTNDVTLTAPANFSIAKTSGGSFHSTATYTLAEANNASSTVFVKFTPTTANTNYSQSLTIATAGTTSQTLNLSGNTFDVNNTLEVVNWNIEWFGASGNGPSNKTQQAANVKTIFGNLNADIYGLSEVVDTALFRNSTLPTGYNVIFSDFGSYADDKNHSGYPQAQKLAFMYRTDMIKPVRWFGVLRDTYYPSNLSNNGTNSPYKNWSSGRFPFLMEAKVLLNGTEETVYFIEIHAKANTGDVAAQNDAYDRRKGGAAQLKQYIDTNLAGKKVIILGDFNDVLNPDQTIAPQPAGTATSYSDFTLDQANYFPVTLPLSLAGKRSTAGFNTVIDNVIINKNLNNNYLSNSAEVLDGVTSLVSSYSSTTTDHYPIQTRYFFNTTLSVNWGYFMPSINGNVVTLKWETKSETDNSHFVIERSLDGKNFAEVAEQKSKGSQGATYQAVDQNPAQGVNYYRVKQVDRDGKSSYSEVKSVRFLGNNQAAFFVYPNPVKNNITLNYSSNSKQLLLLVSGIDGRVQLRTSGSINDLNNQINQKVKDLARGVYIIQITDGGTTYQSKFVKE